MCAFGYNEEYFYLSELFAEKMLGAKVVSICCPKTYIAEVLFDNGWVLRWFEDSEGAGGIALEES